MIEMKDKLSASEWSRYWEKGSLTTFVGGFNDNYDGEIRDFWINGLGALPADAHIIDLATGNGALAILASEYSLREGKSFAITGIDFAAIDPANCVHVTVSEEVLKPVRFLSHTPMEDTGLPENTFDCAISQFGFEYSGIGRSIRELDRVLKRRSSIHLMMHHEKSAILSQARDGLIQAERCRLSGLHPLLVDFIKHLQVLRQKGRTSSPRADKLRDSINEITEQLHAETEKHSDPAQLVFFMRYSMAILGKSLAGRSLDEKLRHLEQVEKETFAYERRMKDLVAAGMSDERIAELENDLATRGFVIIQSQPFRFKGQDFGYALVAKREGTT
jgi:ubiquinone/menaquinone biosynthesis C-methylase UbiE